ncbi:MAG: thioredoxin [Oligoflexus sp.]
MIFDVSTQEFQTKVIEQSQEIPVLVDFWAEWCGPCRMLTPVLEKIVSSMDGRIMLAKVNTETELELAQRYGIRGIPSVKLFVNGQLKSEFQGNLPEAQIRSFIDQFCPNETDQYYQKASVFLNEGKATEALELFQKALDSQPDHEEAMMGLSKSLLRLGEVDKAKFWIEQVNPQNVRAQFLKDLILLMEQAQSPEIKEFADGTDKAAKFYANGLAHLAKGEFEKALESFLESVKEDRSFSDEAARKAMVTVFEELGAKHPLTLDFQKSLARSLY